MRSTARQRIPASTPANQTRRLTESRSRQDDTPLSADHPTETRLSPESIQVMQRRYGNQYVLRMIHNQQTSPAASPLIQREVTTTRQLNQIDPFARGAQVVIDAIQQVPKLKELYDYASEGSNNVDLVLDAGEPQDKVEKNAWATTRLLVGNKFLFDIIKKDGAAEIRNANIKIEIKMYIDRESVTRGMGAAAQVWAHEYAVHATKYLHLLRMIRNRSISHEQIKGYVETNSEDEGSLLEAEHHRGLADQKDDFYFNEDFRAVLKELLGENYNDFLKSEAKDIDNQQKSVAEHDETKLLHTDLKGMDKQFEKLAAVPSFSSGFRQRPAAAQQPPPTPQQQGSSSGLFSGLGEKLSSFFSSIGKDK